MITGKTRLVGLIGWPARHSLSPVMHNAAFEELGLDWRYVALPVSMGSESAAVRGLSAIGFVGVNVTVPHKTTVMADLDSLTDDARAIGAVNTLTFRDKGEGARTVHGHNTDCAGFIGSLHQAGVSVVGERAVVCGAGGSARAVVFGLLAAGAADVLLLARRLDQAQGVASDLHSTSQGLIRPQSLEAATLIESAQSAALLVNATPLGMVPGSADSIWPDDAPVPSELTVYDLVYVPEETHLLKQARATGAMAIGGLEMLIAQGAESFALWTGKCAPIPAMRHACKQAIEGGYT